MWRTLHRLKRLFNDMFSRLCQHLHSYIVRNHITFDQRTHKIKFCLGSSRKPHFDLLKSDLYEHLEKLQLLLQTHRLDQRLISIPKIHGAPDRRSIHIIFFHPVVFAHRRHKILSHILVCILHFLTSIPCCSFWAKKNPPPYIF